MDFTLIKRTEQDDICYKLLRANFYRDYFVIIVQNKNDFYCGSFRCNKLGAEELFEEIVKSNTEPHTLHDILHDFQAQKV